MPTQAKRQRTHTRTGCWTCRARKKKCDETRPYCKTCAKLALRCEGYGFRLRWSTSRDPFVAYHQRRNRCTQPSPSPPKDSVASRTASPKLNSTSDTDDVALQKHLGNEVFETLTKYERAVLRDFIDWGASTLSSWIEMDPGENLELLSSCAESKPFLANCLTYQVTLDLKHAPYIEHYYNRSLEEFRAELCNPESMDKENTAYAGILLCSISMNRAMPWTIHLNGVASILEERGIFTKADEQDDAIDLATLLGVLDLPTHTLGRMNKTRHIWYTHCQQQSGIEEVTGLPHSLVDLLSSIMDKDIINRLLSWPGEPGDWKPILCKMWSATRYAGIISAIGYQHTNGVAAWEYRNYAAGYNPWEPSKDPLIESAVHMILSIIHELTEEIGDKSSRIRLASLYPLVAAGSQPSILTASDKSFIGECLANLANGQLEDDPYYKGVATVLQELWLNGRGRSLNQVAQDLKLELALF